MDERKDGQRDRPYFIGRFQNSVGDFWNCKKLFSRFEKWGSVARVNEKVVEEKTYTWENWYQFHFKIRYNKQQNVESNFKTRCNQFLNIYEKIIFSWNYVLFYLNEGIALTTIWPR